MTERTRDRLSDLERQALVRLLLAELARHGCAADPIYTALLARLNGVDKVVWVDAP